MKLRKITAVILVVIMLTGSLSVFALGGFMSLGQQHSLFIKGEGPEINGHTIDYRYYSPVKENDDTKYPLVIWLHGIFNGTYDPKQLYASDIAAWSLPEYQSRFKDSGGAFIMVPRSLEEKVNFWGDSLIKPLRGAIDDFIAKNKDNIDISRIYLGGYSMGGKMTLKMAVAYPEMFAAIFPICPKWIPSADAAKKLSNMPIWLTSGQQDPIVNYYSEIIPTWEVLMSDSNVAELSRFSTLKKTVYPDGSRAPTPHDAWYAVNYDLFSHTNGDYPTLSTVNGLGESVKLTYPDGIISWLSDFRSDYDGSPDTTKGNSEAYKISALANIFVAIYNLINNFFKYS